MIKKIIPALCILAIILGLLAVILPPELLIGVVIVSKFFDVALPIFGVAALVKYISK